MLLLHLTEGVHERLFVVRIDECGRRNVLGMNIAPNIDRRSEQAHVPNYTASGIVDGLEIVPARASKSLLKDGRAPCQMLGALRGRGSPTVEK